MNVAALCSQHSPMLGQAASSHTVARPNPRNSRLVSPNSAEVGALTRIQEGFRGLNWSGRLRFSGWRRIASVMRLNVGVGS